MKVYVITSGEYSSYGIRAVALSQENPILSSRMSHGDSVSADAMNMK